MTQAVESERLTPLCYVCKRARSEQWLFVSGETRPGHEHGDGIWAHLLLCGTCEIEKFAELAEFIHGLADGYTITRA